MKNRFNMYALLGILIALLLGANACRKDGSQIVPDETLNTDLLVAAKEWRQDQLKVARAVVPGSFDIRQYNPMWKKARYRTNSLHQKVIGVPMFFSDSSYIEMNVVLIEGKSYGIIKKYHRNDQYKLDVKMFSSTGGLLSAGAYNSERGVMTQPSMKIQTLQSLAPMTRIMADGGGIDLEEVTIHGTPPTTPTTPPTTPVFPVDPIGLPGGNNGGTGTGNGDGGGSGGGGGGNTSGEDSYEFPDAQPDTSARPCLKSILLDLKASANVLSSLKKIFNYETGANNVAAMFERVATTPGWDVKIGEKVIPDEEDANGNTVQTNAETYGISGTVRIDFNKTLLNAGTDLSIARTMIHESMHAYFIYGLARTSDPGYAAFVEANDLLYKRNGSQQSDQNAAQHELIAKKYVDQLAFMLAFYARINNITSPNPSLTIDEYCKDLAWGGLMGTSAYRSAPNKSRIEQNVLKEATHATGSTTKKGC